LHDAVLPWCLESQLHAPFDKHGVPEMAYGPHLVAEQSQFGPNKPAEQLPHLLASEPSNALLVQSQPVCACV
jgi:hypothetical protein